VRALLSGHREVRRLKRFHNPTLHGTKPWPSGWILMDYIGRCGMKPKTHVMELGCGWGLAGIYCAKQQGARVTGLDSDSQTFPYLDLHARINGVRIEKLRMNFERISTRHVEGVDVLIGSDICYWETLVEPLEALIRKALEVGVRAVLISDPGRSPFEHLADIFLREGRGEVFDWRTGRPRALTGRILRIDGIGVRR
jgi:predicted nicotinamide N-methyase